MTQRQKGEKTKKNKDIKKKRQKDKKTKLKREFYIVTSGQFRTLTMILFLSGLLIVHYFGFKGGTHSQ